MHNAKLCLSLECIHTFQLAIKFDCQSRSKWSFVENAILHRWYRVHAKPVSQSPVSFFLSRSSIHSEWVSHFSARYCFCSKRWRRNCFFFGSVLFKMTFHFNHNSVWWLSRHRCCFSSCTGYRFALNQLTFISTVYFKYFAIVCNIQQPNSIIPFENLAAAHYPRDVNKQLCWMILLNLTIPFWKTIILCFFFVCGREEWLLFDPVFHFYSSNFRHFLFLSILNKLKLLTPQYQ